MVSFTTVLTFAAAASAVSVPSASFDSIPSTDFTPVDAVSGLEERGLFDGLTNGLTNWLPWNKNNGNNGKSCDIIGFANMLNYLGDAVRQILSIANDLVTVAVAIKGMIEGIQIMLTSISLTCLGTDLQIVVRSILNGILNIKQICNECH